MLEIGNWILGIMNEQECPRSETDITQRFERCIPGSSPGEGTGTKHEYSVLVCDENLYCKIFFFPYTYTYTKYI